MRDLLPSVVRCAVAPAFALVVIFTNTPSSAQEPGGAAPDRAATPEHQHAFAWESGKVTVKGGLATIDLPEGWRYLQQRDARHVVEHDWGNPPDPSILGLVVPPGEENWAIIVSFDDSGYVSDSDAAGLDYDELLKGMQAEAKSANAAREKRGYPTVELLGWAEAPHYDAKEKKIYWAKSLAFEGEEAPTLNYCVRLLAADGVLEMNAVAGLADLREVATGAKQILAGAELVSGHRYADHDPSLHKVAAYGIGGLIAGKVLAKAGLFKVLLKPLIAVGVILVACLAKLLGKSKRQTPASA